MAPEVLEAPFLLTVDEWFAGTKEGAPPANLPDSERVYIKLTLDQASFLWVKLYRHAQRPPKMRPESLRRELLTVPAGLLGYLWERLEELPPTTPHVMYKGRVRFHSQSLTLLLRRHQAKYLLQILNNKQRDEWRREKVEEELFAPLKVALIAEEGREKTALSDGVRRPFFRPTYHESPASQLRRFLLGKAFQELPRKLKMHPKSVKALLDAFAETGGNVSEAARKTHQPQRKTARRIKRILAYLKRKGFSA